MSKIKIDVKTVARISAIITMLWTGAWLILCMFFSGEKLEMINSIHPWKIWTAVLMLAVLTHLILGKIKPDLEFKGTSSDKLKFQVQFLVVVLMISMIWSDLVEVDFPWTAELVLLISLELLLIMDDNARGIEGKGKPISVIITGMITAGAAWVINRYIDSIGQMIVLIGLKIKSGLDAVLYGLSGVILWLNSHIKIKAAPYADSVYENETFEQEEISHISAGEQSYLFMKYIIFVFLGIIGLFILIGLISLIIDKLKALWERRNESQAINLKHDVKRVNPLRQMAGLIKGRIQRIKAIRTLNRNKDSVGYALYELEKKYRGNRKLRRRAGETPTEFIERIIQYDLQKDTESNEESKGKSESERTTEILRLRLIAKLATRAAYDRDFSWLEPLP